MFYTLKNDSDKQTSTKSFSSEKVAKKCLLISINENDCTVFNKYYYVNGFLLDH